MPKNGLFIKPTLLTDVHPASTVAQQEIFGPVLASMTFRTPAEAVELANNTPYGLAACVWSESINVALDVAAQVKAGVVWVNSTNLFDAACGFGGYRESGYGREGGKEGMFEYLVPAWTHAAQKAEVVQETREQRSENRDHEGNGSVGIDRTVKQYIGGKQARPDSGYSFPVYNREGKLVGEAPLGNRKDIRNAVEAAASCRQQVGQEPLHTAARRSSTTSPRTSSSAAPRSSRSSPSSSVSHERKPSSTPPSNRAFTYAAWCDKFEGSIHNPPFRMVTLAMKEAIGTVGILAPDDAPLLGLLSLVLPAIAMGNSVVAVPSERCATLIGELYQVFDTSDLPGGVVNLVAGRPMELGKTLSEHDDVDAIWSFRDDAAAAMVKLGSAGNLKQVWTNEGRAIDWFNPRHAEGLWYLQHATQVKNIWVPYGE